MKTPTITNVRNALRDSTTGLVDLEICTEEYGWIPSTVNPAALEPHEAIIAELVSLPSVPVKAVVEPTLSELIQERVRAIKAMRVTALEGLGESVTTADGRRWKSDTTAESELTKVLTLSLALGAVPADTEWRDVNNDNHPATLELLKEIASKIAVRRAAIWKASWQHIDAIRACTTVEAVKAYPMPVIL